MIIMFHHEKTHTMFVIILHLMLQYQAVRLLQDCSDFQKLGEIADI